MPLIKSISGIRGTIGGAAGQNLTPQDIVECSAAFGYWTLQQTGNNKIVVGRDARISGEIVANIAINTLRALGIDVVDLGLSTTPTVEMAVVAERAGAGIIFTASHNPKEWNALKFLNHKGEFISAADGEEVLRLIETGDITYASVNKLGSYTKNDTYIKYHINEILALELVDVEQVRKRQFKIVVDCINSTGAISIPVLLDQLGCKYVLINETPNGQFEHNPEPLPQHLTALSKKVRDERADLGIVVDPDVDRLAFVTEDGEMFGEEYTLVAIADYVLSKKFGTTVSNLSSTRALKDVTEQRYGSQYFASAVGEVNVVTTMKNNNAVIGGEGNGGIILPELHYGRDALVGIALFLTHLAGYGKPASFLRKSYPHYVISKNKIQLTDEIDLNLIFDQLAKKYKNYEQTHIDGLKISFDNDWIHLRKSNTESIIRIYTESTSKVIADNLANKIKTDINEVIKS